MKKSVFTVAAAIMMATCVLAQDIPADMRMEIIESDDDSHDQYTIFMHSNQAFSARQETLFPLYKRQAYGPGRPAQIQHQVHARKH